MMENLKAKITISRPSFGDGKRKISITVKDVNAVARFLDIEIDYDKFTECLTGLSESECTMKVRDLWKIGKKRETMVITFEMPKNSYHDKDVAKKLSAEHTPEGWTCSGYFNSQDSFFQKFDKYYAKTGCTRWV